MVELVVPTRAAIAHHEAGHAIAYIRRGYNFRYVTLHPRNAEELGLVRPWRPQPMRGTDHAQISAAGPLAELCYTTISSEDPEDFDIEDLLSAFLLQARWADLGTSAGADVDAYKRVYRAGTDAWRHVAEQVAEDWPVVVAVAEALLDSPRALTYREVQAIAMPLINGAR